MNRAERFSHWSQRNLIKCHSGTRHNNQVGRPTAWLMLLPQVLPPSGYCFRKRIQDTLYHYFSSRLSGQYNCKASGWNRVPSSVTSHQPKNPKGSQRIPKDPKGLANRPNQWQHIKQHRNERVDKSVIKDEKPTKEGGLINRRGVGGEGWGWERVKSLGGWRTGGWRRSRTFVNV